MKPTDPLKTNFLPDMIDKYQNRDFVDVEDCIAIIEHLDKINRHMTKVMRKHACRTMYGRVRWYWYCFKRMLWGF